MLKRSWLEIISAVNLLAAVGLFVVELVLYSRTFTKLPAGLSLGGVPVGGLSEATARAQVLAAYTSPIELYYLDSPILLDPAVAGFQVNIDLMLPQTDQYRTPGKFWSGFWNYLWVQPQEARDIPLHAEYSQSKLRAFLQDIAERYDRPGAPPQPDVQTHSFVPGTPGHSLDIEAALPLIEAGLHSPTNRRVVLPVVEQTAISPSLATLGELLRQEAGLFAFDGTLSIYLANLQTGEELIFNLHQKDVITGAIAFSGMSTIKIPVMVSFFGRREGPLTDDEKLLLQRTIDESANASTDWLLRTIGGGDGLAGTRLVTADMQRLGLVNTYLSGLLDEVGAVLAPIRTPANSRSDVDTHPDPYNQTTAEDMGALLVMIQQCSTGGGALLAAFPGQFTPQECSTMIDLLTQNAVGPIFISGGTPEGVVAHKHGWDHDPLTNVADAALVYTPTGNYALTIYIHNAAAINFQDANRLMITLAQAVYTYFNPTR